ncbi:hypothetical protein BCR43DRAFT_484091 [Syncephalastrum racemosum]|uniref:peptidylprolyl isomerase n=1 Tax=Syncephalastrum racemosum TaxID=13706 RepID=A0A1X2HW64_SYNRA|nr:hypothetical protein BCR43DRAFT_484091 [Syncephalastrum racemosum]
MFKVLWALLVLVGLAMATEMEQPIELRGGILKPAPSCKRKVAQNGWVKFHYRVRAWGADQPYENTFGSEPVELKLGRDKVMEGLEKGMTGMCEKEVRRILIPAHMAYGELGLPGMVPPNTALIYDVEVLQVQSPFASPWFWGGLVAIAIAYVIFDRLAKSEDQAKAAKYMEKKKQQQESKKDS